MQLLDVESTANQVIHHHGMYEGHKALMEDSWQVIKAGDLRLRAVCEEAHGREDVCALQLLEASHGESMITSMLNVYNNYKSLPALKQESLELLQGSYQQLLRHLDEFELPPPWR